MARTPRNCPKLDSVRLEEIALGYVARYATSQAKLNSYLLRKLRERGWEEQGEPPLDAIAARLADAGYVDDAAYARARADSLLRRGYGVRRLGQALAAAGIGEELRADVHPDEAGQRAAALALARRRGFGPYGAGPLDQATRQKQLAAMVRAGHGFDLARALVDAPDVAAAEQWAGEAHGDSGCD